MAEVKFGPVPHDREAFLARARGREDSSAEYESLELEYRFASQLLKVRSRASLTQHVVAERIEQLWLREAARRASEIDQGLATRVSADEVRRQAQALLK